jgi:hypothetical protein
MAKDKKNKEKITYIDDGRSFADLSGVSGIGGNFKFSKTGTTSSPREIWNTYWAAVKFMFKPMLVVIGFLCILFLLSYIVFVIL